MAFKNGGIHAETDQPININPDLMEVVIQISKSKIAYDKPILIFKKDEVLINDKKELEKILARPSKTITSL
ncbi:MAG: hypothetical protein ACK41T_04995 [Pseudobdellovibrio sp.]